MSSSVLSPDEGAETIDQGLSLEELIAQMTSELPSSGNGSGFLDISVNYTMSNITTMAIPEVLVQDYLNIAFLLVTLAVGVPLNLVALVRLVKGYMGQMRSHQMDVKTAFTLLKLHLNIANLLVLIFYNSTFAGWLITYRWIAGDFLCKAMQTLITFSYHSMSNIIVCVAVDRLRNVCRMVAMVDSRSGKSSAPVNPMKAVKLLLGVSWCASVLLSIPQLFIWRTVALEAGWEQCTTMWDERRMSLYILTQVEEHFKTVFYWENIYLLSHLITIFWTPFAIILICYTIIIQKLLKLSCSSFSTIPHPPTAAPRHVYVAPTNSLQLIERPKQDENLLNANQKTEEGRAASPDANTALLSNRLSHSNSQKSIADRSRYYSLVPTATQKITVNLGHKNAEEKTLLKGAQDSLVIGNNIVNGAANNSALPPPPPPPLPQPQPQPQHYQRIRNFFRRRPEEAEGGGGAGGTIPDWRIQMRSKMFRTSALVVGFYILLWAPYNIISLIGALHPHLRINDSLQSWDWVKTLKIVNVVINPFLYEFGKI